MISQPVPRPRIFDLFWRFAVERHAILVRRYSGYPSPWTEDSVLSRFKFCNTFRAADRVSQYLIREVAYRDEGQSRADVMFQILAFRLFSKIETWEAIRAFIGRAPVIADLVDGTFASAVADAKRKNKTIYTSAFILCASDAFGQGLKHLNHIELLKTMFVKGDLGDKVSDAKSLAGVYSMLHVYPLMGPFMSYQTAIDMNYSAVLSFSEDEFTQPGPGALRGLKKVFLSLGGLTPSDAIIWMVERQELEFSRLGFSFGGLWGRRLHAIDCQGLFCETDKYCREYAPELASNRSRIKTRFRPSGPLPALFFPPKWGVNSNLPQADPMGNPAGVNSSGPVFSASSLDFD